MDIISKIEGGIGSQMFCYAAAKRLALRNNANLWLDILSGYPENDYYKHQYRLSENFNINAKFADKKDCYLGFFSRKWRKFITKRQFPLPPSQRVFLSEYRDKQKWTHFQEELLTLKLGLKKIYLEGVWNDERYFLDIRDILLKEFELRQEILSNKTKQLTQEVQENNSICVHFRLARTQPNIPNVKPKGDQQLPWNYYEKAINFISRKIDNPHLYYFCDTPEYLDTVTTTSPSLPITIISHNDSQETACQDLHIMKNCKHFIIANSAFSWWGAWLGKNNDKIVVSPRNNEKSKLKWSGNREICPSGWLII